MTTANHPTPAERFFFDNNGYLVLERFLAEAHVSCLLTLLECVVVKAEVIVPRSPK